MEYHRGLIGLLIIFNIILSGVLIYNSHSGNEICLTGGSCEIVQNSQYSQLFGLKLTDIGVIAFTALLGLYIIYLKKLNKHLERLFILASILGALMALSFIYIQFFLIGATCSNCMIIDSFAIIIALLVAYDFKKKS